MPCISFRGDYIFIFFFHSNLSFYAKSYRDRVIVLPDIFYIEIFFFLKPSHSNAFYSFIISIFLVKILFLSFLSFRTP